MIYEIKLNNGAQSTIQITEYFYESQEKALKDEWTTSTGTIGLICPVEIKITIPTHYYEWGNEGRGWVTCGRFENDVWIEMGKCSIESAKLLNLEMRSAI